MLESSKSAVEGSYSYAQHLREIMLPPSALLTSSCSLVFNLCFLSPPHLSLRVYAIVQQGNVLVLKGGAVATVLEVLGIEGTVDIESRVQPN